MHGRSAKTEGLGLGGQRSRRREAGEAEEEVEVGIEIPIEEEAVAGSIKGFLGQIEVASTRLRVGEKIAARQPKLFPDPLSEPFEEDLVGEPLNRTARIAQERMVSNSLRIGKVDEESNPFPAARREDGPKQAREVEGRKWGKVLAHGKSKN
jgi:hypothetical protein